MQAGGSTVSIHSDGGVVYTGSPTLKVNAFSAARVGDKIHGDNHHDSIKQGIGGLQVDGKALAVQDSPCTHHGKVTSGSPNVYVAASQGAGGLQLLMMQADTIIMLLIIFMLVPLYFMNAKPATIR